MKMRNRRGCAAPLIALLLGLALNQTMCASNVTWNRIEVDAHLDNSSALHVREVMFVTVDGEMPSLERKIATSTDQAFILQRLVREEAGGQEVQLIDGWDQKDRYMWRDQKLTWWIRNATDPKWEEQPLVYRFDYEIRNALSPAWDIPAGPDSFQYSRERFPQFFPRLTATMAAWVHAPALFDRRYRLEHDVIFPWFSEREREELKYTLRYDTAWRRVHPESEIGRGTRGRDFRVTQLLDYLAPGWPPAMELWKPATRVGSILGFATLAGLLWVISAITAIRHWGLIPRRRDRGWFQEHVGSQHPEMLAWALGKGGVPLFVAPFLERLRANGVIAIRGEPAANEARAPTVHLQLLRDPARLEPYERLMIGALFPRGSESGTAVLAQFYATPGFSPEDALEEAIEHGIEQTRGGEAASPSPSLLWRIVRGLMPWACLSAAALLVLDSIYGQRPMELVLACAPLVAAAMFISAFLRKLIARFEMLGSGGMAALVTLVPVLLGTIAVVAMHFYRNTPLTAPGSAAVALLALWCVAALLSCAQGDEDPARPIQKRLAALGARYARQELLKRQPQLDDAWIPHLAVLGLESQLANWRAVHHASRAARFGLPVTPAPGSEPARPFTGISPVLIDEEWIDALSIPSEEERKGQEEEDDDSDDSEEKGGEEK